MAIKSFRGKIDQQGQETIHLHTNNGAMGYRIKRFELFQRQPGISTVENLVQIWKIQQTSPIPAAGAGVVDFSDQTLLGAAFLNGEAAGEYYFNVIFDNEIFNQDIFVTHTNNQSADSVNYYIELEQVKLDLNENTVATLKDIRNIASQ